MSDYEKEMLILRVAIPSPLRTLFDYLPPKDSDPNIIKPGMRVLVPFGNREMIGVIWEVAAESKFNLKLKPAFAILDEEPLLSKKILKLIKWTSDYYHHPIGDVIGNVLPKPLREEPRINKASLSSLKTEPAQKNTLQHIKLNEHQISAIDQIKNNLDTFKTFLLDGVTGSGKTEVYLQVIAKVIAEGKQALVLIPEINLTPQTISRFSERFPVKIAIFHSRLTAKQRLQSWLAAKDGDAPIIIGTRSAIFTPLKNPGIIIVDEEHDLSFKQQTGLRYSARDLAVVRGKIEGVVIVLGSATPSVESVFNLERSRYHGLKLPERAGSAIHPEFHLVDMRNQRLKNGIAENLLYQIEKHISNGGQVLLFLNRRGFSPVLICNHCGWHAGCKHCDARLTLHKGKNHLRCHHCGTSIRVPIKCPECSEEKLLMLGAGTERVELALQELFPDIKMIRIDRDTTTKKNSLEDILKNIHSEKYQILIGTQMLAKGHHFPKVTMAAVLNVDQSLFSSDFRASEHLAQLIVQVAGRAGRAEMPGEVYLQTHNPNNPLLLNLIEGGYQGFVNNCFEERKIAELPPYSYLALLQAESKNQQAVAEFLNMVVDGAKDKLVNSTKIFGPVPTTMERKGGYYRMQLLVQNQNRTKLQQSIEVLIGVIEKMKLSSGLRWFLDVDPVDLNG